MNRTVIPYDRALPVVPGRTPYTRPDAYLEKLGEGDYAVRQGRRPSTMLLVEALRRTVGRAGALAMSDGIAKTDGYGIM